jgi:hypothetical protein
VTKHGEDRGSESVLCLGIICENCVNCDGASVGACRACAAGLLARVGVCAECARHLTEASAIPGLRDVLTSEVSRISSTVSADVPGQPVRFTAHRQPPCWNFLYHSTNCFVRRWFCVVLGPKPPLHRHN